MASSSQPTVDSRHFVVMATVSGLVLAATVLLWVVDVVPFGVFLGVLVAVAVAQAVVVMLLLRGARERASRADRLPGGASTIGPDSPGARYGYDPMGDLGQGGRR
ncbi:hypothetical protein SAMN05216184_102283 [Georgenia satyanarayanai]|uniref:Uncharacterized protein n=1 Tax=Georgenia satyanarayanai TaxID=860221 RepID=A0A2Y9A4T0_9MICO|nr:hypothetical protein [Georgenia satyanarayanai]PYG01121.1 hypothetical protein A8987_102283 [Georgenia satyanarayanai]SSA39360.1 hypothetical protein SAMN05216184_102283 [Georgenia satyanarayanai]